MSGKKAEQRYSTSIQQGQRLDNATQMGQDELSILTRYVTPSAVIVFGAESMWALELCYCVTLPCLFFFLHRLSLSGKLCGDRACLNLV